MGLEAVKDFKDIIYEKDNMIAKLTINRAEVYNAYTLNTLSEMSKALLDASWDDSVGVIVITGAGDKAFCTGGDVAEYESTYTKKPRDFWKWCDQFERMHHLIRHCGKVVIARLNGIVAGGGNEIHLSCDLSVAAEHVNIMQVGTKVGSVAAGGATQWLPLTIGDRRAREMLFTCDKVDAKKALQWGLVNDVVPYEKLDEAVDKLCQKILDKFPECTRFTKAQVNFWKDFVWALTWPSARDWLSTHFATPEPHEGMGAFVEKRPVDFRGLRKTAAEGGHPEFFWGTPTKVCQKCGSKRLPDEFKFCGVCGNNLE